MENQRRNRARTVLLMVVTLALPTACSRTPPASQSAADQPLAWVNDKPIPKKRLLERMAESGLHSPEEVREAMRTQALVGRLLAQAITEEILYQEALRRGVQPDAETEGAAPEAQPGSAADDRDRVRRRALIETLVRQEMHSKIEVTRAEIDTYYASHRSEFERPRTAQVRQIVLKTRDEALDVLRQLRAGADFGELAAERSIAPEADVGGDLGTVTAEDLQPEISEACFSLPVGQLSREIESPFGFHVIQILARNPPTTPTLQDVEAKISETLQSQKREAAFERWLADLRAKANIRLAGQ